MAQREQQKKYAINIHIRDIAPDALREYAKSQGMNITEVMNAAVWYCQANNIDLAIWSIEERRKAASENA